MLKVVSRSGDRALSLGSDNEIAQCVARELLSEHGQAVFSEGDVHVWATTHWTITPRHELTERIRSFDGASFPVSEKRSGQIRVRRAMIESTLSILQDILSEPDFFAEPPVGINAANGFLTFDGQGRPSLLAHHPDHRQRHVLPGAWRPDLPDRPPEGSLLATLLRGCFLGDPDSEQKCSLLAEAAGAAALGIATQIAAPKALVLYGPSAENGKSQVLDLMRALLPEDAVSEVSPGRFGDEKYLVGLAGKLLNATDEMGDGAILSDTFKSAVTGDRTQARDLYRSVVSFRPQAMHVLACNQLPAFQHGMDAGVRRRLAVIKFNRSIPPPGPDSERIEGIGKLVGEREPDQLLRWAAAGAARLLIRGAFTDAPSGRQALAEWILSSDPIRAWLSDYEEVTITGDPSHKVHSRDAYARFRRWSQEEGLQTLRLPVKSTLTGRIRNNEFPGLSAPRRGEGAFYTGLKFGRA